MMKLLIAPAVAILLVWTFSSCSSSSGPATFCDTACLKDSIKFTGAHELQPYVYLTASQCDADTITWSYSGLGTNRKLGIPDLLGAPVKVNKDFAKVIFNDTAYAWLLFNDCGSGRGYQVKLVFNKSGKMGTRSSGINNMDPKFSVADNIIAHTDRGNIIVEDALSGKTAMMTFGKRLEIDYNDIHAFIDSVNISASKIWAKVKIDGEWKELQKNITLE
jgi:hypothetical protein